MPSSPFPSLAPSSTQAVRHLGRGLAVVALADAVSLVALFPPTTIDDYAERLALGSAP